MPRDKGKQFEAKFKEDFLRTLPNSTIDRLVDSVSGYKAVTNISDFIGYRMPYLYYLECKTHKGSTLPFQNITQYEKLTAKVGIPGVRAGVIIWFYEYDKIWYVPISTITKMKQDGKKSINVRKDIELGYNIIEIPSIKKRTFMVGDYSILESLKEGE